MIFMCVFMCVSASRASATVSKAPVSPPASYFLKQITLGF